MPQPSPPLLALEDASPSFPTCQRNLSPPAAQTFHMRQPADRTASTNCPTCLAAPAPHKHGPATHAPRRADFGLPERSRHAILGQVGNGMALCNMDAALMFIWISRALLNARADAVAAAVAAEEHMLHSDGLLVSSDGLEPEPLDLVDTLKRLRR